MAATDAAGNTALVPLSFTWSIAYSSGKTYVRFLSGVVGPTAQRSVAFHLQACHFPLKFDASASASMLHTLLAACAKLTPRGSHPSQNVTSCTSIPSAIQVFAARLTYGLYAGAPVWGRGCHSSGIKCKLQLPANQLHGSELWASCTAKHGSPSSVGPKCGPLGTLHSQITVQWTQRRGLSLPGAADWQCNVPKSGPINNSRNSLQRGHSAPPADGVPPC